MLPDDLVVDHRHAEVNGIRMHYVEKGIGPLVVLLHGFPEMWWSWRYQIVALAEAGFRVVAPDLRGYNDTDATGPFDIGTLRDDVVALFDHLGSDKPMVVGHDWGGAVAWHLARTRPARCGGLAVINCPYPALLRRALFRSARQLRRSWYMFFFQLPLAPEWLFTRRGGELVIRTFQRLAVDGTNFGRDELLPFAQAICKPGRAKAMIDWYRTAFRGRRHRRAGRRGEAPYQPITIPTLLVWAMEDRALGYDDLIPGTERYVHRLQIQKIEGCGHFAPQERPEEVNRHLLAFLKALLRRENG